MDLITLAICNKKIAGVLAGIDRIEVDDPNKRLTFYFPNGTSASMNFPIPRDGASITDIKVNEEDYNNYFGWIKEKYGIDTYKMFNEN